MKKFLLIAGGAVIMAAASVWGYSYHQEQTMDPWLKANIAALSSAEDLPSNEASSDRKLTIQSTEGYCYVYINGKEYRGGGKPMCQKGNDMTRCPDCYISPQYN